MAIFDRSWYGRVLVERVEELTPRESWLRAYDEINSFEGSLAAEGTIIVKLWLQSKRYARVAVLRTVIASIEVGMRAWDREPPPPA